MVRMGNKKPHLRRHFSARETTTAFQVSGIPGYPVLDMQSLRIWYRKAPAEADDNTTYPSPRTQI